MRSPTASDKQPVLKKAAYQFEDWQHGGYPALSIKLSIRDMASYYAESRETAGSYRDDWNFSPPTDAVPRRIHNADDALAAVAAFTLPASIRARAARSSRLLYSIFEQTAKLTRQTDLTSGRLDRAKLPALARATASGTYDVNVLRPYRRIVSTQVEPPIVAVIASGSWGEMWEDASYIPRVAELTLGIQWAAEAAGLKVFGALVQSNDPYLSYSQPYRTAVKGLMLAEPGLTTPAKSLAVLFHRDLFRYGSVTSTSADLAGHRKIAATQGMVAATSNVSGNFRTSDGGQAVAWARAVLRADVVIAIGAGIKDRKNADVALDGNFSIEDAVVEIAAQARRLNSKER